MNTETNYSDAVVDTRNRFSTRPAPRPNLGFIYPIITAVICIATVLYVRSTLGSTQSEIARLNTQVTSDRETIASMQTTVDQQNSTIASQASQIQGINAFWNQQVTWDDTTTGNIGNLSSQMSATSTTDALNEVKSSVDLLSALKGLWDQYHPNQDQNQDQNQP